MRASLQAETDQGPEFVIIVSDAIVHWMSNTQTGSALNAHTAELNNAVLGTKVGVSLRTIVADMLDVSTQEVILKLGQDNHGTIRSMVYEVTSREDEALCQQSIGHPRI